MYEVIFNNNFIINFLISFIFIIFNYFFARLTADYLTNRGIISVNNFNPLINKGKNIPYLVDQHVLEK